MRPATRVQPSREQLLATQALHCEHSSSAGGVIGFIGMRAQWRLGSCVRITVADDHRRHCVADMHVNVDAPSSVALPSAARFTNITSTCRQDLSNLKLIDFNTAHRLRMGAGLTPTGPPLAAIVGSRHRLSRRCFVVFDVAFAPPSAIHVNLAIFVFARCNPIRWPFHAESWAKRILWLCHALLSAFARRLSKGS